MAQTFDDELLQDAADDAKCVEFIRAFLPQELKEKFSDEELFYFLDLIYDYYSESGVLDQEPDADGCIDIDLLDMAEYMADTAEDDKMGTYSVDDLQWIAQAEAEYCDLQAE